MQKGENKMKKGLLSKLAVGFVALFGVFAVASCEQANHSASVPTDKCEVKVVADASTGKRTAVVTLGIANPTIYNIYQVELTYDCYELGSTTPIYTGTDKVDVFVRHGVGGYLSYTLTENQYPGLSAVDSVRIRETTVSGYYSLWDTYMPGFVSMFVIVGIALVFVCVDLFRAGWTKELLKERMRERVASTAVILALVLLICLVPLLFSNWVTTLILVGGFVGFAVLAGILTLIRSSFLKY